jgi:hypothetical protein
LTGKTSLARGYADPAYAKSVAEFGAPRLLPRSRGWVLERAIHPYSDRDAMGCYPLFSCVNWSGLKDDLDELADDLVAVSLVADPFGDYTFEMLRDCFGDGARPFKEHFIADLSRPIEDIVSRHHRRDSRSALRRVAVERCETPAEFLDDWSELYANLVERHRLKGIKAFSRHAFAMQLRLPGMTMLRASINGQTVGAHLWLAQGDVVHSHLAASSPLGYEANAAYALHWFALKTFSDEARWLNFGGAAGLDAEATDGLTWFKRGWSTETRTAYFCARILNEKKYADAIAEKGVPRSGYFPAYRQGEL